MNTENLAFSEQGANISKPPKTKRSDTDRLKECYTQQKKLLEQQTVQRKNPRTLKNAFL